MTNVLALTTFLAIGSVLTIAPLLILLVYKFWKENPNDIASTQKETQ